MALRMEAPGCPVLRVCKRTPSCTPHTQPTLAHLRPSCAHDTMESVLLSSTRSYLHKGGQHAGIKM